MWSEIYCVPAGTRQRESAANGFRGQLRSALSDSTTQSRFSHFLALCRQEQPEIEVRIFEAPLVQQIKGLHDYLNDLKFAQLEEAGDEILAEPVWSDLLMVAVATHHPLLSHMHLPLDEVLRHPLVLGDPQACEVLVRQVDRVLRRAEREPFIASS